MVVVMDHDCARGRVELDRLQIGGTHVHGDCLELGPRLLQPRKKGPEGLMVSAFRGKQNLSRVHVYDDCHVAVALADGNLIDADATDLSPRASALAPLQFGLDDLLDQVPADPKMASDGEHGHRPGQINDQPAKGPRIALAGVGDITALLLQLLAVSTAKHVEMEHQKDGLAAHRQSSERVVRLPFEGDIATAARHTPSPLWLLLDVHIDSSPFVICALVIIAVGAKGVIDEAG